MFFVGVLIFIVVHYPSIEQCADLVIEQVISTFYYIIKSMILSIAELQKTYYRNILSQIYKHEWNNFLVIMGIHSVQICFKNYKECHLDLSAFVTLTAVSFLFNHLISKIEFAKLEALKKYYNIRVCVCIFSFPQITLWFDFLRNHVMLSSKLKSKKVFDFNHWVIWNLKNKEEGIHLVFSL